MKRLIIVAVLAMLAACGKKNPVDQTAQDIKAMGAQRDKAKDAVKALEESQQQAKEAADKAAGDDSQKN